MNKKGVAPVVAMLGLTSFWIAVIVAVVIIGLWSGWGIVTNLMSKWYGWAILFLIAMWILKKPRY